MKKIGLFVFILLVAWLCGLGMFTYKINHLPIDEKTKTDAIVVLTGGRHRLAEAITLLNEGYSDKLFISGVQKNASLQDLEKRNAVKAFAAQKVTLDKIAANTFENARETNLWMKKEGIRSVRLVTSNYHVFRSLVEFRRWNRDIKIIPHPVFSEKIAVAWWKNFDSFYFLAQEYNKFLVACVRAFVYRV